MLIDEIIKCRSCGYEFGNDVKSCDRCKSHICPKCGECSCPPYGKLNMN